MSMQELFGHASPEMTEILHTRQLEGAVKYPKSAGSAVGGDV